MSITYLMVTMGFCGRLLVPLLVAGLLTATRAEARWSTGYYRQADAGTMPASEIHFAALTHAIHMRVVPSGDGSVMPDEVGMSPAASSAFVSAAHGAGVKALLGVANGASRGADFSSAASPAHLDAFVGNLIALMQSRGYDGIDIDWEPLRDSEVPQFKALVLGLRAAMDEITPRPILTAALWHQQAAAASLEDSLDQVNIMTYDMGKSRSMTWHNAALYASDSRAWSVEKRMGGFVEAGVSPAKLGIGLPFYGYIWRGGTGTPTGGTTAPLQTWATAPALSWMNYNAIMLNLHQAQYERWDAAAQVSYLSIDKEGSDDDVFVSYDDPKSIVAKVSCARSKGHGGWIIWDLSADYFPEGSTMAQKHPLAEAIRCAMEAAQPGQCSTSSDPPR